MHTYTTYFKLEKFLIIFILFYIYNYDVWCNSGCKLINGRELAARDASYDLGNFERTISKMCSRVKEELAKHWLPKIQGILIAVLYDMLYNSILYNSVPYYVKSNEIRDICMHVTIT